MYCAAAYALRPGNKTANKKADRIMSHEVETTGKQLLHLVFGGELEDLGKVEFKDLEKLDVVGIYPNYAEAHAAWKSAAQQTVDNAQMRYFVVHMHRLLEPDEQDD